MSGYWSDRFLQDGTEDLLRSHPNGVVVHGVEEPMLSLLDLEDCPIEDMFIVGIDTTCGRIFVETKLRAEQISRTLEPAYRAAVESHQDCGSIYYSVKYAQRALDSSVPTRIIPRTAKQEVRKNWDWAAQQERIVDFAQNKADWFPFGELLRELPDITGEEMRKNVNILVRCEVLNRRSSDDGTETLLCAEWARKGTE